MGITKYTSFEPFWPDGSPTVERVESTRMASYHADYLPEVGDFLDSLRAKSNHIYILSNALGGSEVWGSNRNGDLFPAKPHWGIANTTKGWGYPTFVDHAHVFRQHKNRLADGHPSYGRILFSAWNPKMWRVETVAEVRRGQPDIEDVISALDANKPVAVSMGCRIPFDECTLCGHRARVVAEHCEHLKKRMNEVMPDGLLIAMVNYFPVFFDQSFVRRGADPSAWAHRKVAEGDREGIPPILSSVEAKDGDPLQKTASLMDLGSTKRSAARKHSAMYKEVPGGTADHARVAPSERREVKHVIAPRLSLTEEGLDRSTMRKWATRYPLDTIMTTLYVSGIDCRPQEFQYMALCASGQPAMADRYADDCIIGSTKAVVPKSDLVFKPSKVSVPLYKALNEGGVLLARSYEHPFLLARAARWCNRPNTTYRSRPQEYRAVDHAILSAIAVLYQRAKRLLSRMDAVKTHERLREIKHHLQVPGIPVTEEAGIKDVALLSLPAVPAAYFAAGSQARDKLYGKELGAGQNFVMENPIKSGIGAAAAVSLGRNQYKKHIKGKSPKELADKTRKIFGLLSRRGMKKKADYADMLETMATDPAPLAALSDEVLDYIVADSMVAAEQLPE